MDAATAADGVVRTLTRDVHHAADPTGPTDLLVIFLSSSGPGVDPAV
jgi:hypothetical protein